MDKIIVTGATSMLGIALIEEAVRNGTEVYAFVRPSTKRRGRLPNSDLVKLINADLKDLLFIKSLPMDCDVLYHFAWIGTDRAKRDDPTMQTANISYTLDAVELAHKCGCKKFVGAGSQAEYGRVNGVISESTRFAPETAYGVAKYAAGLLSRKKCDVHGIIHIWGRIFSIYGRYDNEDTLLDYAVKRFLKGEMAYFTAGTQMWDYLHEKDAGKIFYLLGEKVKTSKTYRVAYGESKPLKKYIEMLAVEMDADGLCNFDSGIDLRLQGLQAQIQDLIDDIGYSPRIGFVDGIRDVLYRYRKRDYE